MFLGLAWDTFWLPNIIQATLFAALAAAVGIIARKYFAAAFQQIFGEQVQTRHAAEAAATRAQAAQTSSASANKNSADANEAIAFMADRLGQVLVEKDYMARRNDRMLAVNLEYRNLLTQNNVEIPARLDPTGTDTSETEAQTITGKHRLRTSMIPTASQETVEP